MLSGPPNIGPGAAALKFDGDVAEVKKTSEEFYDDLARFGGMSDCSVDVFCVGCNNFAVPMLQRIVYVTGGVVMMSEHFDATFEQNVLLALTRATGRYGSIEWRISGDIEVSQVIGPTFSSEASDATSINRVNFGAVQPGVGFALIFSVLDDIPGDSVDMQLVIRSRSIVNKKI